jgi:hypothetical protein
MRALAAVLLVVSIVGPSAQQPRDNRPRLGIGTGAISGVVLNASSDRAPLRRVRVTVNSVEIEYARTVLTGDDGRFEFGGLPPGRYVLVAAKEGYVTTSAGAQRLGRPGNIELAAGASARVDLALSRGAVITGRVQMPNGEAAQGIAMVVLRHEISAPLGERRLVQALPVSVETDDRGEYRVYGLAPGTYYVRAQPRFQMVPGADEGLHIPTAAEIRAALAEVKTELTSPRPGMPPRPRPAPVAVADNRRGVTLAPIYFPGTSIPGRATPIAVQAAEIRSGVDIDLEYVSLSTVSGFVSVPPDTNRVVLSISSSEKVAGAFSRTTSAGQDGGFAFRGVPPGPYALTARVLPVSGRSNIPTSSYWGTTDIVVSGEDLAGVTLALQPGLTIAGRIAFTAEDPPDLAAIFAASLQMQALNATFATNAFLPPIRFDGQSFRIDGVVPGTYRFSTVPRGIHAPIGRWWLKSFTMNGREMLDQALEIRENSGDAMLTFSDVASELSGHVHYASGIPVREEMVIVFSTDPRHWFHGSRRIAAVRPTESGRYAVRNLPAGDYFIATTGELAQGEWYVPEELKALSRGAVVVRIGRDERVVQDVRLNR